MTRKEELLTILMEECAEIIVAASKIKRFGESSVWNNETALDSLEKELGDLQCIVDLLHSEDMVSYTKMDEYSSMKHEKLKKWSNLF
jgi:NTP pyrophosphatase (non-canonical NTP hydrolase)